MAGTRATHESILRNPRKLGVRGFLREAANARREGPTPETVFRLFRPFHGPELDAIYRRVMADPTGRRILEEGKSLHPVLLDFDRLHALPDGTLGRAYADFMESKGIDIVSFAEASLRHMDRKDYATDEAWALVNRARDIHELVHVVSGYGTDELGEMCELAFVAREDPRPRATRLAIRINVAAFRRQGFTHGEAVIAEAYRRGARSASLLAADWEALLPHPLDQVRAELGISPPPPYVPIPPTGEAPRPVDLLRSLLVPDPGASVATA